MLCDYLLSAQYVFFRYGSHIQAQDGTGCIWLWHSESCTLSFNWRTRLEDSQLTVSRDNLDVMLPESEGLS